MACEDELVEVERLERLMDEENEDFWMSTLKTGGGVAGFVAGVIGAVGSAPSGVGPAIGTAAATAGGLSAIANFWGAMDAWDDYNQLEDQYGAACQDYRDCMG
jgi:hypothetical protein